MSNQDMAEMKLMMKKMLEGQQIQGAKIDGLVKRMDSMEGKMVSMEGRLGSVEGKIGSMEEEIASIRENMATKDDLAALEAKMDANFKVVHEKIDHLTAVSEHHTLMIAKHDQDIYLLKRNLF